MVWSEAEVRKFIEQISDINTPPEVIDYLSERIVKFSKEIGGDSVGNRLIR